MERSQKGIQCFESLRGKGLEATTGHSPHFSNCGLPRGTIQDGRPGGVVLWLSFRCVLHSGVSLHLWEGGLELDLWFHANRPRLTSFLLQMLVGETRRTLTIALTGRTLRCPTSLCAGWCARSSQPERNAPSILMKPSSSNGTSRARTFKFSPSSRRDFLSSITFATTTRGRAERMSLGDANLGISWRYYPRTMSGRMSGASGSSNSGKLFTQSFALLKSC